MNKQEKVQLVKAKLSELWECYASFFDSEDNAFIETERKFFEMVTFGHNIVIRADKRMLDWCKDNFTSTLARDVMDSDNFYLINEKLRSFGKKLGEENTRYLHLFPERIVEKPQGFDYKMFDRETVNELYEYKEFNNALNFKSDVLAIAAYCDNKVIALAGADDYLGDLWQIGIDTVHKFRSKGLGMYLVKELALEIENHSKLAYYTTWSANIASTRLAIGAGFRPVWVQYSSEDLFCTPNI